jgi:hypothetical protein
MGVHNNIDFFRFPKQDEHVRVKVTFNYDLKNTIGGIVVRNDLEEPFQMIILLDDGRVVLSTECQYSFE